MFSLYKDTPAIGQVDAWFNVRATIFLIMSVLILLKITHGGHQK
jgi:hypothetical protein